MEIMHVQFDELSKPMVSADNTSGPAPQRKERCYSKHMTGDRSRLMNFVKKFIETIRFENDHFGAIMGYGDYVIGDSVIFRVYYVKGLGHKLFSVRQFCDSDMEVAFRKHSCYVRDTDGVELIKGSRGSNLYTISVEDMMKSSPICFVVQSLQEQIMVMASAFKPLEFRTGPAPIFLTLKHISLGLVPNPVPAAPYVPPTNKDLEMLFQPMFDEYLEHPHVERPISSDPAVQVPVNSASTPSSTTIDQDTPSPSHSPSSSALQSPSLHQGVAAESTLTEDNLVSSVDNNPFVTVFALEPSFDASSSGDVSSAESTYISQKLHHLGKCSKDHPLDNVIGNPSRPIYKVKLDEYGDVLKNKARLVAKGYRQDEGIDFEESSAPVSLDPTLFTQKTGKHILRVQIYVDDIIFASTDHKECDIFSNEMSSKFQMSMMGKMSFLLCLEVSQSPGGIFINQSKFALEILKKFGMDSCDPVDTPMVDRLKLDEDPLGILVDQTRFCSMVGSLMYLTANRPDLVFAVCMCTRYQASPIKNHLESLKQVFRYLRGTIDWGLWYPKDTTMALTAYVDADHA
nr:retrovirus-related Pol polyprotein from transposon TNT 1-94 [Tanacetum cinerariifolium]